MHTKHQSRRAGLIFVLCSTIFLVFLAPVSVSAQEIHYAIRPNPALAAQCQTDEGREAYWQSLTEGNRADVGFQAQGLGLDPEQYRQAFISEQCNLARDGLIDTYERTMPLGSSPEWSCYADWNDSCRSNEVVAEAPSGYQICRVTYDVAVDRGDTRFRTEPRLFLPDVSDSHRRFRQLAMWMDVRGRGTILDQRSSHLRVRNLLVTMVPDYWPDSARNRHGCIVPPAPPAPRPPTSRPGPTARPMPATVSEMRADGGRSFRFGLANSGTVPTTMGYEVYLTTPQAGERLWGHGVQTVQPNTTWLSDGYHNWDATRWRLRTFMIQQ